MNQILPTSALQCLRPELHAKAAQRAQAADWTGLLMLASSEHRLTLAKRIWRRVPKVARPTVLLEAYDGDQPSRELAFLIRELSRLTEPLFSCDLARAAYHAATDAVTVYRGTVEREWEERLFGVSWNEAVANSCGRSKVLRAMARDWLPCITLVWLAGCGVTADLESTTSAVEYRYERPSNDLLIPAQVLSITDGDTFRALIGGQNIPVRMADYDAPERDQPYGRESTYELAVLLGEGIVQLEHRGDGGFGRIAARVFVGDVDVNYEMVRRGAGWFDPEYAQDEELYIIENAARDAAIGLWALPADKRIEPWVWRRLSKESRAIHRRPVTDTQRN